MHGELVFTTTSDYLRLHGLFCASDQPQRVTAEKGSIDAAILIHGLAGDFYSSRLLQHFAKTLLEIGVSVVLVNTRGHDMINTSTWAGRARSVGAALEDVDHCRYDVNAWVDWLVGRGFGNVLLFGHSLDAIKSLYAQAYGPHPKVRSIIGLSATRLSFQKMINSPSGDLFRETMQRCESLVKAEQGEVPIRVPVPFPTWMTPKCYLDKYGPDEKFNWLRFIEIVTVPSLLIFGGRELSDNPAFAGLEPELAKLQTGWNSISVETIPEADHFYTSKFGEVDDAIVSWLTR